MCVRERERERDGDREKELGGGGGGTVPPFSNAPFYIGKFPFNFVRSAPFSIGKVPLPFSPLISAPLILTRAPFPLTSFHFLCNKCPFSLLRSAPSPLIIALFKSERCPY